MTSSQKYPVILAGIFAACILLSGCETTQVETDAKVDSTLAKIAEDSEAAGDYEAAVSFYQRALKRNPDDLTMRLALSRNLRHLGEADEAGKVLSPEKDRYGENAIFLLEFGKVELATGNAKSAVVILKKATEKMPDNWQALTTLGIAYDMQEMYWRSADIYQAALMLSPNNPAILNNFGMSQAQAGQLDDAIATLKKALAESYGNTQIRQNLALLYGIKGDNTKAEGLARKDLGALEIKNNMAYYKTFRKRNIPDQQ
ncbi:MAG: tetratricopeptide repeat protein [Rhodospirillaceae bacterium]|jgi:Flp pilus assembly protein TadD|nr:tetratricopeptide repeat protein [Rhodospirillaceae bacterium]MBT5374234.1 tetratricopeptide repeat protein [Rhodospirillaceae bacterium]MBT5659533.1 tetratricopeptide repeat protein [Rhodospirillaceae bacterium]MBT5751800.1 tetratricopeptide repeat protein [Rhodospirillaceae bacterium]